MGPVRSLASARLLEPDPSSAVNVSVSRCCRSRVARSGWPRCQARAFRAAGSRHHVAIDRRAAAAFRGGLGGLKGAGALDMVVEVAVDDGDLTVGKHALHDSDMHTGARVLWSSAELDGVTGRGGGGGGEHLRVVLAPGVDVPREWIIGNIDAGVLPYPCQEIRAPGLPAAVAVGGEEVAAVVHAQLALRSEER